MHTARHQYGTSAAGEPLGPWGEDPRHFDPSRVEPVVSALELLFGPRGPYPTEAEGAERVPSSPVLLASNHSGGVMIPDGWALAWLWYRTFGNERALSMLGHSMVFAEPHLAQAFAGWGALKASPDVGLRMLRDHGRDALVMPGGDIDVMRPYRDSYRVCFGGRCGYAKLALRAGVPVVPVANSGAHGTLVILRRGRRIARMLGLQALVRANVFPISLTVPWGLTIGPWPHLPIPARMRFRFGEPVWLGSNFLRRLDAQGEPTPEAIEELDRRVRAQMQRELDALASITPSLRHRLRHGLRG